MLLLYIWGGVIKSHCRDCFAPTDRDVQKDSLIVNSVGTTIGRPYGVYFAMLNKWSANKTLGAWEYMSYLSLDISGLSILGGGEKREYPLSGFFGRKYSLQNDNVNDEVAKTKSRSDRSSIQSSLGGRCHLQSKWRMRADIHTCCRWYLCPASPHPPDSSVTPCDFWTTSHKLSCWAQRSI